MCRYGFVQPQVKLGRAPPAPVKVSKGVATSSVGKHLAQQRQYPVDCGPLVERQPRNVLPGNTPVHGAAVMRVSYSSACFAVGVTFGVWRAEVAFHHQSGHGRVSHALSRVALLPAAQVMPCT